MAEQPPIMTLVRAWPSLWPTVGLVALTALVAPGCREAVGPANPPMPDTGVVLVPDGGDDPPDTGDEPDAGDPIDDDAGDPIDDDAGEPPDLGPSARPSRARAVQEAAPLQVRSPLAVAVSPVGDRDVFFSAIDAAGQAGIWRIDRRGTVGPVVVGSPLVLPVGLVVNDEGNRLWVADMGARRFGALLEVVIATGSVGVLYDDGDLIDPAGLAFDRTTQTLWITGTNAFNGQGGIWTQAPGDAAPISIVPDGLVLEDPSGIVVSSEGILYVFDTLGPDQRGAVWRIDDDGARRIARGLRTGFPSGLGLSIDDSFLLVTTSTPTAAGGDTVLLVDATGAEVRSLPLGLPMVEPRGVTTIPLTNQWIVIDGLGGPMGAGAIYRLE